MTQNERFSSLQWLLPWALIGSVFLAAIPFGASRPLSWTMLCLAILIIFILQLIVDNFQSLPTRSKGLWLPAILYLGAVGWGGMQLSSGVPEEHAHSSWMALRSLPGYISADPGNGHQVVMRYLCYAMIFWIAYRACVNSARKNMVLKAIAVFSTLIVIFGLWTHANESNWIHDVGRQGAVLSTALIDRNGYAIYAAFGLLANSSAYLQIIRSKNTKVTHWRSLLRDILERLFDVPWLYAAGVFVCLAALLLTQSRIGAFATLVGIVIFLTSWRGKRKSWNVSFLLAVGIVIVSVVVAITTGFAEKVLFTETESNRFAIYPGLVRAIFDRPFLGHGLGAFSDAFRQYLPASEAGGDWATAHNLFLENALEFGIPAAVAFYSALLVIVFRIARTTLACEGNRPFLCFSLAIIATATTHSLFDSSLQTHSVAALFTIILAMGWAQGGLKGPKPSRP